MNGFLLFLMLVVVGAGPFIAVHIGGKIFDADDDDEDTDDRDDTRLHMY